MTMYCSGEPKCVDVAPSEINDSTSCPPENEVCGALREFVIEYTNELPGDDNPANYFSFQMCGYFTDQESC